MVTFEVFFLCFGFFLGGFLVGMVYIGFMQNWEWPGEKGKIK